MSDDFSAIKVNKVSWASLNIQYYIIFKQDRLLFVKIGGQFADGGLGTITGAVLGGAIGAAIGSAVDSRLKKRSDQKKGLLIQDLFQKNDDEIMSLDKKNYKVMYDDIKTVQLKKSTIGLNGARAGVLTLETAKKENYDIVVGQDYALCDQIVRKCLGEKFL